MPSELVYQHQQQTPINGTISGMARPGSETGYYHIPVANLPWQTSWQELKDHVRTVCTVEHVEINEDSTSGHVVLKGRANFDAAFRLLNGGIFHDRALIADGRNADDWVLVKQHVEESTSSLPLTSRRITAPAQHPSPLLAQPASNYEEWSSTSPISHPYVIDPAMPTMDHSSYLATYTVPGCTDPAAVYRIAGYTLENPHIVVSSAVPYLPISGYPQQYPTTEGGKAYKNAYTVSDNSMPTQEGNRHYTNASTAKLRKSIIIEQLQSWTSESQIRELIRQKAGSASEKLRKLDLPLADGQQGVNCGYAIATFETEDAAEKVTKRLNNCRYQGLVLEVKYTKEGGAEHHFAHGSRLGHRRHTHHHSRRERHDEKEKQGKEKEGSHKYGSSNEKKGKSYPANSDVVIAHGSSPLTYA